MTAFVIALGEPVASSLATLVKRSPAEFRSASYFGHHAVRMPYVLLYSQRKENFKRLQSKTRNDMSCKEERALLDSLFDELFPLLRSITGPGIEESDKILGRHMPLDMFGVPSGRQVFDWITPPEWHCRSAAVVH
ncbi:DUF4910 domain-containing protein [Pararobbsia silviterrae]|uniref:DUF4910 domain-containing protein n=1 Tax=Pararobbsia silviterrae TaxID=1792498 RepID=A0A494XIW6_9BURK|nr:DUF4910 domain-containing protein [Pararobbsia silviterrae]RKP49661.1 DUF4910 domain-containing protein [Pararobbsia silviterrae]